MIVVSFSLFLLLFVVVGMISTIKNRNNNKDYLLAGQTVKPWLVALSAVATNNSGYMFVGMIGYTYMVGLSSVWLVLGWVIGDFIASIFIYKKIRIAAKRTGVLSFAGLLSNWNNTNYRIVRILGGFMVIVFLGTYAAAQLNAGSKALHVLFEWNYAVGATIGAIIVLLYCFSGGIRASIWTDAAQSFVMIIAMGLLFFVAVSEIGGLGKFYSSLQEVSPNYMNLFHDLKYGPLLFVTGWIINGFGVIGQPHIMVRYMAMDKPESIGRVRIYYYSWYIAFYTLTLCAGFAARLLIPEVSNFDAELALPKLAQLLIPQILIGLVLAGLFAATMSTADSQILSCVSAITRDFSGGKKASYAITKLSTVFMVLIALGIALFGSANVFDLVLMAWSALAATFAPLITIYCFGGKPSEKLALAIMLSGIATLILWKYFRLEYILYEGAASIIAGFMPYIIYKVKKKFVS